MDILVIGRGGREHALIWALKKSPKAKKIYAAPGNGGIATLAECVPIAEMEFEKISAFAKAKAIDLVVVAPDEPLGSGLVDYLESCGIAAFGPKANAALIESSKIFMKSLLKKYDIPTARYEIFDSYEEASHFIQALNFPIVIKADGLAAGKGVTVARTLSEAQKALDNLMVKRTFGLSGAKIIIEEFLTGQEMSLLAFVDGEIVKPMPPSQDHKPVFEGDLGPNTGGMGTYSPLPHIQDSIIQEAIDCILQPTALALVKEGRPFKGILYAGLMMTKEGVKAIEFNARFGDPETQVLLPKLKTDLLEIMLAIQAGTLDSLSIEWSAIAAVCVILASKGYPNTYEKGLSITGLEQARNALVFHAGTMFDQGTFKTSGGRVLGITALGADIEEARANAYADVSKIHFEGMHYRKDIALKALEVELRL